ncbi:MAG: DUF6329 domain-containing protein [Oscillospiraceae bacterium]|nr:DUF6329 domain-containing protein [Oscillospiraceae bacterium]
MLETKAVFRRKDTEIEAADCVIDKIIRLSGTEFDRFSRNLMHDWDFIRNNAPDTVVDEQGRYHCLLVIGEGRRDGILVDSQGSSYARYSAFMPNVEDFLSVGRYSALKKLNKKLTDFVDVITEQAGMGSPDKNHGVVDLESWGEIFGIDFTTNGALRNTVLAMLDERTEIRDWELDKNMPTVYRATEPAPVEKKPSTLKQIRDARKAPKPPRKEKKPGRGRGEVDL